MKAAISAAVGQSDAVLLEDCDKGVPPHAHEVYDVVGARDTVAAYFATMLASDATAGEAAAMANVAAGIEMGQRGAATVDASEMMASFATGEASQ